jgi:hypothetical protein
MVLICRQRVKRHQLRSVPGTEALLWLGWKSASGLMVCCIEPIVKAPRLLQDKASYRFIPLRRGCKGSMDEADA